MKYRVRVAGRLGAEWSELTGGLTVTIQTGSDGCATTELTGAIADAAALMGVLQRLYTHGARILAVECLDGEVAATGLPTTLRP